MSHKQILRRASSGARARWPSVARERRLESARNPPFFREVATYCRWGASASFHRHERTPTPARIGPIAPTGCAWSARRRHEIGKKPALLSRSRDLLPIGRPPSFPGHERAPIRPIAHHQGASAGFPLRADSHRGHYDETSGFVRSGTSPALG